MKIRAYCRVTIVPAVKLKRKDGRVTVTALTRDSPEAVRPDPALRLGRSHVRTQRIWAY
jgi:hypothetical protein